MFQAGHLLCSKQDISCVSSRTFPVFHAGLLLCSKQDISYVPSRTSPVFQRGHLGHLLLHDHQKSTCHFLVNSADRPGIIPDCGGLWSESRDDRLNSPKSGVSASNGQKIARIAPILTIFGRNRSRRPKPFFYRNFRVVKKFSRRRKLLRRANEQTKSKITLPAAAR